MVVPARSRGRARNDYRGSSPMPDRIGATRKARSRGNAHDVFALPQRSLRSLSCRFLPSAQGQYPSQPIKLIVPYAAGGLPDTTARIVCAALTREVGKTVVVENRPAAPAALPSLRSPLRPPTAIHLWSPTAQTVTVNPVLFKSLNYGMKDLTQIRNCSGTHQSPSCMPTCRSTRSRSSSTTSSRTRAR